MSIPLVGEDVIVIHSPYSSVPNGTIRKVESIRYNYDKMGHSLYKLSNLPNQLFWEYEIRSQNGNRLVSSN
jgi:hypothetical protein